MRGALQGIHIGLSHAQRSEGDFTHDRAERVLVSGNSVQVYFSADEHRERHGIFLGNIASAIVENNFVSVLRSPLGAGEPIDGIRIYGEFGVRLVVAQNHLVDFDIGVRIHATNPHRPGRVWRTRDNVGERTDQLELVNFTSP